MAVGRTRKWMRRIFMAALGLAVLAAIVYAFIPPPLGVDVALVERGTMLETVDEDGRTRVRERYVVSAPLAGQLLRIDLHAGDPVRARRTLLAAIEPRDPQLLDARSQAEAEARVGAAEAALRSSRAQLERAEVDFEFAESERLRAVKLIAGGYIPEQEFEMASQKARSASEGLNAARFDAQVAEHQLQLARAALNVTRHGSGGRRFEILAPVDGVVLRVMQESTTAVEPSQPLLELGDAVDLEVVVDVLSSDGVRIDPGAVALLERWGGSDALHGRVRLVEPAAFTKISALGVEEQRVNVIIDFVDPPQQRPRLGDAFRVDARIVVWEGREVVKIPLGALFREGEQWAVFRFEQGRAVLSPLKVGHRNWAEAEVLDGLQPGDRVIVHPSDQIRDGSRVAER